MTVGTVLSMKIQKITVDRGKHARVPSSTGGTGGEAFFCGEWEQE